MKNLFNFKTDKVNNHTTNTTSTKGVTTMKKASRIIAGILSAVTIFSVGAISITSTSAASVNVKEITKDLTGLV